MTKSGQYQPETMPVPQTEKTSDHVYEAMSMENIPATSDHAYDTIVREDTPGTREVSPENTLTVTNDAPRMRILTDLTTSIIRIKVVCLVLMVMVIIMATSMGVLLSELKKKGDATEGKIDVLHATVAQIKSSLELKTVEDRSTIQKHTTRLTQLESDFQDLSAFDENNNTIAIIQQHTTEITQLASDRTTDLATIQRQITRITDLEEDLEENNNTVSKLQSDRKKYVAIIQQHTAKIDLLESNRTADHATIQLHNNRITDIEEGLARLNGFDCLDVLHRGLGNTDGVYSIRLNTSENIQVYCDMTTDGGGWTVFQKRFNGNVEFYRNFSEYVNGFGSLSGEFWLGLKYVYLMTKHADSDLRLDLENASGSTAYEVYQDFSLSAHPSYTLHIGSYSGTAGDSGQGLSFHNGRPFATFDRDDSNNCGFINHGGWWYHYCAKVHLNGEYVTPGTISSYNSGTGGVIYRAWTQYLSLKSTEMKFRRK